MGLGSSYKTESTKQEIESKKKIKDKREKRKWKSESGKGLNNCNQDSLVNFLKNF